MTTTKKHHHHHHHQQQQQQQQQHQHHRHHKKPAPISTTHLPSPIPTAPLSPPVSPRMGDFSTDSEEDDYSSDSSDMMQVGRIGSHADFRGGGGGGTEFFSDSASLMSDSSMDSHVAPMAFPAGGMLMSPALQRMQQQEEEAQQEQHRSDAARAAEMEKERLKEETFAKATAELNEKAEQQEKALAVILENFVVALPRMQEEAAKAKQVQMARAEQLQDLQHKVMGILTSMK